MKKILSFITACCVLCLSLPAFAYDSQVYFNKASELYSLIEECKALGINTQYEEIDRRIINTYANRIGQFENAGLSSSIVSYQQTELDNLYQNAKANLIAYKNGTKTPKAKAYTYQTGDGLRIDGASLKNAMNVPYFSAGHGHFSMAEYVAELSGYGFDNIQTVAGLGDIVTTDRPIDCWDKAINGGADITFTPVTDYGLTKSTSLHVVNNSAYAANVYGTIFQRIPVKPNSEYEISFYVKGTGQNNACYYSVNDFSNRTGIGSISSDSWKKVSKTFTTEDGEYIKGLRMIFERPCDVYIDNITVKMTGSDRNVVNNGGFDGDGTDDFDIFYNSSTSLVSTLKTLYAAEQNNTHVEVLLQLQQGMPSCILNNYPEIGVSGGRYNIDHLKAQEVEEAYIRSVLGTLSDYSSLGSIIVANEPDYNSSDYSYSYDTKFANYLQSKYGNISSLNSAYGTSYSSFSNVGRPSGYEKSARFYDWKSFNDGLFTAWYAKTVGIIKECIPGIPVSVKIQTDFTVADSNVTTGQMAMGIDAEALGALSDFHGNDSYGYLEESGTIRNQMKWYDYLNSIAEKPIYDSERHITKDGSTQYNDNMTRFYKNSVWMSMIHGLDMYSIWTWDMGTDSSSTRYGHLALRPGALSEAAKAALDANRLASKVTAIANAAPSAAILRTDASRIFNNRYMHALSYAYNAANEAGHKVGFVTPENIAQTLSDYEVLIIPYATNVEPEVINAISQFGGKIVMMDSSSLGKNQYNKSYSGDMLTKINAIKSRAQVLSVSTSYHQYNITGPTNAALKTELVKGREVTVTTTSSGSLTDDVEWQYVPYKNGYLVSINNYNTSSSKSVTIKLNGTAFSNVTSLIDMQDVSSSITLEKMSGGLYYARNTGDEITDDEYPLAPEPTVPENNFIKTLTAQRSGSSNILEWTAAEDGSYNIYGVEPDGTLSYIAASDDESFTDPDGGIKTYCVKCVTTSGEKGGKFVTCGLDLENLINASSVCEAGYSQISVDFTNNAAYSVAYTLTATSYNGDGTFNRAAIIEQLVPSGKTATFEKSFETTGVGTLVITVK